MLDREREIAKANLAAGQKDRAVIALRRRKYQEGLLSKTDGQLENLEQLVSTIEFSLIEVSVLHGLKLGNDVLKEIHKEINVESVEKLLDESHEAQAYQREIDEMLSNQLTLDDEDAIQAELSALQAEALQETQPMQHVNLPSVPTTEPTVPVADAEEREAQRNPERIPVPAWTIFVGCFHQQIEVGKRKAYEE